MTIMSRCDAQLGRVVVGLWVIAGSAVIAGCSAPVRTGPGLDAQDVRIMRVDESVNADESQDSLESAIQFKTLAEAQALISSLGPTPTPLALAKAVAEIQEWPIRLDEMEDLQAFQSEQLSTLRKIVATEVRARQDAALEAGTSPASATEFAEAQRVLVLYPISDDEQVIAEAQKLSVRQAEVSKRLESLRRQRYNQWAVREMEKALEYFNKNKSNSILRNRNEVLISPMANRLGVIDPAFLEPVASDLYKYVVDKVQKSLSETNWLKFVKEVNNPQIVRKSLGEI